MIEHDHTFSTYTYCNFNQFTQRNLNDAYQNLPDVVPTPSKPFVETPVDMWAEFFLIPQFLTIFACSEPLVEEVEPKIPSLLSTAQTCPRTISTQVRLTPISSLCCRYIVESKFSGLPYSDEPAEFEKESRQNLWLLLLGQLEYPTSIEIGN